MFAGALVAAILSTVDSTLLVSSGLLSHNLLVPYFRITDEGRKVLIARGGVLGFGLFATLLALTSSRVLALVELGGLLVYVGASGVGLTTPFLASLTASLIIWGTGCALDSAAS